MSDVIAESPSRFKTAWEGALWKILSCACFAAINGIVRYLGGGGSLAPEVHLPTNVILFFQNVFGTLFLLPFFLNQGQVNLVTRHFNWHLVRAFSAVLGIALWYFTLKHMPIAIGLALSFTGPVFTVIGAKILLGERVNTQRALAIVLSLLGAFIISRPDHALFNKGSTLGLLALLPLGFALALAWNKLLTRKLAQKGETPESLATYLLLLMAPISLLIALPEWVTPSLSHWPWLILMGLLGALAHISFGKAYKCAEVVFLTPFGFSKFLFSTLIGYCCFLEIPSYSLWLGILVIGMSIFLLAYPLYPQRMIFRLGAKG